MPIAAPATPKFSALIDRPLQDPNFSSIGMLLWCCSLVFLMTPGVGLLYSGLSRSKNALSLILISMLAMSIVTIQWVLFGFSLAFYDSGSTFIGGLNWGGFKDVAITPVSVAPTIPGILFALYQMQFATITPALIFGSVAERIRLLPAMLFIFIWTTLIYDPVAYWTWAKRGWLRNIADLASTAKGSNPSGIGAYDYAGGGPVHIASGFSGLAYCLIIGKRRRVAHGKFTPHNLTFVFIGTALLWFGWFGFNGGSALAETPRAAMAATVTTIAAAAASLTWMTVDYFRTGKWSGLSFCCGAIAGLVTITPCSGFVAPWAAILIGIIGGISCNYSTRLKELFGFDDSLDAWGLHAVGGFIGNILVGIFAQKWIAGLEGVSINGGWAEGNWAQVGYQLTGSIVISAWSFVGSYIILFVINLIPGLHLRPSSHDEDLGGDRVEMGEIAYEIVPTLTLPSMASGVAAESSKELVPEIQ